MLVGSVANLACGLLNVVVVESYNVSSFVFHAKQNDTTFAIGKSHHFFSYLLLRCKV